MFWQTFWRFFVPVSLAAFVFGFPAAELVVHGLDLSMWPPDVRKPVDWFAEMIQSFGLVSLETYRDMVFGRTHALGPLGLRAFAAIAVAPLIAFVACFRPSAGPRRDPSATYGDARWANSRERSRMRVGLELGLDPVTRRPIRVTTESHLITIAPPRTGKTSGLVIPNLLAPERRSWFGPCVVIDPKGEVYRAVAARRRAIGRTVRCLDPIGIVGGTDTWNGIARLGARDILYLQRVARALLPQSAQGQSVYFQNRANALMVGAFLAARTYKTPSPRVVSWLLSNPDAFLQALVPLKGAAVDEAKSILKMEPRARDDLLSTAAQGFSWCADERLQHLTNTSSFALADLSAGDTDLFVTLPTEDIETLAPLLRWLLCELFASVRRNRPAEQILCFIDEAAAIGRLDEVARVAGELPGHGLKLWSFWQSRSQMVEVYGEAGATTLLNTAEIVTYSDFPLIDPDGRDFISRALGDYTVMETVTTRDEGTQKTSHSQKPAAVRLMSAEAVGQIDTGSLLVVPNSPLYAKHPMIVRKTRHDDSRFVGLGDDKARPQ